MMFSGRRRGGDARTHNLPLTGISNPAYACFYKSENFVCMQNRAFVPTCTFRMKSMEGFINEAPGWRFLGICKE